MMGRAAGLGNGSPVYNTPEGSAEAEKDKIPALPVRVGRGDKYGHIKETL